MISPAPYYVLETADKKLKISMYSQPETDEPDVWVKVGTALLNVKNTEDLELLIEMLQDAVEFLYETKETING